MNKDSAKDYLPFVQALAEGKVVQVKFLDGWSEHLEFSWDMPVSHYRIKPEPREIWANLFPDGYESPADYKTKESARENDHTRGRAIQVCYREVIE